VLVHFLSQGNNTVGKKVGQMAKAGKRAKLKGQAAIAAAHATVSHQSDAGPQLSIPLSGVGMDALHASITVGADTRVSIDRAVAGSTSKIMINGVNITSMVDLQHNDRVLIGETNLFLFQDPAVISRLGKKAGGSKYDWDYAQNEMVEKQGAASKSTGLDVIKHVSREQVVLLLPMINECNSIFDLLKMQYVVSIAVLSGPVAGLEPGESTVMVKLKNLKSDNSLLIGRNSFFQRRFALQRKLALFEESKDTFDAHGEGAVDIEDIETADGATAGYGKMERQVTFSVRDIAEELDLDPFFIKEEEVTIGTGSLFLSSMRYNIPYDDVISVLDYKGRSEGRLKVAVTPFNKDVVTDPKSLIGKSIRFTIKVSSAELYKPKFAAGVRIRFTNKHLNEGELVQTAFVAGPHFGFNAEWTFTIVKVTQEVLDWLENGSLSLQLRYIQRDESGDAAEVSGEELTSRRRQSMANPLSMSDMQPMNSTGEEDPVHIVQILRAALAGYSAGVISQDDFVEAANSALGGGGLPPRKKKQSDRKSGSGDGHSKACAVM
jgi:hypothetical protein